MRRLLLPAIATAVALAILVGLGVWQVERLAWKEGLIARVTARLDAPAGPAPPPSAWGRLDLADLQYEPVAVTGRFDNRHVIHVVQALTEPKGRLGGIGYMVMTPLTTADGWTVYVNRGFVPADHKDPATRAGGQIEGEVTVTGLLRAPYDRSWFAPADNGARNEWFSRDPVLYAKASGIDPAKVAPYIIDAKFDPGLPGGMPQGGETIVTFPNNHLQYAITWFGLAAALLGVFNAFAWGRLRKQGEPEQSI
jgi:surfeit locus 1 family protein